MTDQLKNFGDSFWKKGNDNMLVFGKDKEVVSTFTKHEILRNLELGKPILVFDFNNAYTELCELVGGTVYRISDGSGINPLQIHPHHLSRFTLNMLDTFEFLRTLLEINENELEQRKNALNALENLYNSHGIDINAYRIYREDEEKHSVPPLPKQQPTLADFCSAFPEYAQKLKPYSTLFTASETTDYSICQILNRARGSKPFIVFSFEQEDKTLKTALFHTYLLYVTSSILDLKKHYMVIDDLASIHLNQQIANRLGRFSRYVSLRERNYHYNCSSFQLLTDYGSHPFHFADNKVVFSLNEQDKDSYTYFFDEYYWNQVPNHGNPKYRYDAYCFTKNADFWHRFENLERDVKEIEEYLHKRKHANKQPLQLEGTVKRISESLLRFEKTLNIQGTYEINGYPIDHELLDVVFDQKTIKLEVVDGEKTE